MLDLNKLVHALAIERCGSFTVAAAELGLTQSALSRSIASLEERWGILLFKRSRSGIQVTSAGKDALTQFSRLIDSATTLDHNMLSHLKRLSSSFSFGLGPFIGHLMMADLTRNAATHFPHLKISSYIKNPDDLVKGISLGSIEFAIFSAYGCTVEHDLNSEIICQVPYSFVISPTHPLHKKKLIQKSDISRYPLMINVRGSVPKFETGPKIECADSQVSVDIVTKSDTIWYCSPWMIRDELRSGKLIDLSDRINEKSDEAANLSLFYAKGRHRSPAAVATIKRFRRNIDILISNPTATFSQ